MTKTENEWLDLDAELVRFGADGARRIATVEIAKRLVPKGAATISAAAPGSVSELSADAQALLKWRDDPAVDEMVKYKPLPEDIAFDIADATLRVAAATPAMVQPLRDAIEAQATGPKQMIGLELAPYIGVSLVLLVARFGFVDGKVILRPMQGKDIVEIIRSLGKIVGVS